MAAIYSHIQRDENENEDSDLATKFTDHLPRVLDRVPVQVVILQFVAKCSGGYA